MTKKKERRTPPPTMESIAFKAELKQGKAIERRGKKVPAKKAADKTTDKLYWSQEGCAELAKLMVQHKDDQAAFFSAATGSIKSMNTNTKKDTGPTFNAKQVEAKARQLRKKAAEMGLDLPWPKKQRAGDIDYKALFSGMKLAKAPK